MPMSHLQTILILLASLFFLPALGGNVDVPFKYCPNVDGDNIFLVDTVTVSRNHSQFFNVSVEGSVKKDRSGDVRWNMSVNVIHKIGITETLVKFYNLCEVGNICYGDNLEEGTQVKMLLPDIPIYEFNPFEEVVALEYMVSVSVDTAFEVMCIDFKLPPCTCTCTCAPTSAAPPTSAPTPDSP